jgi:hypothetical protein|tara:strand:+ start:19 stop:192 length:174 start_codon:yes stop_codon:yes gene_type:complete
MDKEYHMEKVEKLISKVNQLDYKFSNRAISEEMDKTLEEIINLLETYSYNIEDDDQD